MTGAVRGGGAWDPRQCGRFADQRVRPALELFARVEHRGPKLAVDLGCGAGEIARLMAGRWPDADVTETPPMAMSNRPASRSGVRLGQLVPTKTGQRPSRSEGQPSELQ